MEHWGCSLAKEDFDWRRRVVLHGSALERSIRDAPGAYGGYDCQPHKQVKKKPIGVANLAHLEVGSQRPGDPPPDYSRGMDP